MSDLFRVTTNEFIPVPIYGTDTGTASGKKSLLTSGLSFSIVPDGSDESTFTPAVIRGALAGFQLVGYTAGTWRIWAKVSPGNGDEVILNCGTFTVY